MELGGNLYCWHCGRVLPECDEYEPYPWRLIGDRLYCLECWEED